KLKEQESGRAKDAERHAQALTEERDRVVQQEFRTRSHLYAWEMIEGQRALTSRDIPQVLDLLNRQRPGQNQRDVRGCEWHYLCRLCHGQRQTLQLPAEVSRVAFSPDGKTIATQVFGGDLKLWEAATGKEKTSLKFVGGARCLAVRFSPGGMLLAVAVGLPGDGKGEVRLYDPARLELLASMPPQAHPLLVSDDSKIVAAGRVGGDGRQIKVWNLDDPSHPKERPLAPGQGQVDGLVSLDLSRDGRNLAAAFRTGGVRMWQLPAGQARLPLKLDPIEDVPVGSVALSPDGKTLATAHGAQFIFGGSYPRAPRRVVPWDVAAGKERRPEPGARRG